ncbi:hypothetical protein Q5X30_05395 [Acinetobacter baumannii]|nr:hypothetical protein [Acinetobacter baumannii]MDO7403859.1 hypothetical protein [Acinetobacter baumannii]
MLSKSKIVIDCIGQESLYVLEKSGSAIYKTPGVDTNVAKDLLKSYKEGLQKLKTIIDSSPSYDNSYYDFEFKTMIYAIDKLLLAIGNIKSEDDEIEAAIFQSYLRKQDESIRKTIEEEEAG